MFFSPILKENSPQNEVFKKKSAKCDDSVSKVRINSFRALAGPSHPFLGMGPRPMELGKLAAF